MKSLLSILAFLTASAVAEEPVKVNSLDPLNDPRRIVLPQLLMEKGEEPRRLSSMSDALFIICWFHPSHGQKIDYQISGIEGMHTLPEVERFLRRFYASPKIGPANKPGIIVAADEWGAASELDPLVKELSKTHQFDVYYFGFAFHAVNLTPESDDRLKLIREAFAK